MTSTATFEQRYKVLGVPVHKIGDRGQDGTLIIRGYFTSDNKDEAGDIITRGATERALPKYKRWGNIRFMHLPRPVAKVLRIGSEDGLDWNEVEIKVIDPEAVFMVEQGLLNALSVGILIRWEDLDFMEDGGMLINDYMLAEISLVDHPANYDAMLKDVPVSEGLRVLARQYGFDALARSMADILTKELPMETEVDGVPAEAIEVQAAVDESAAESVAEPVAEVEDVPSEPVVEPEEALAEVVAEPADFAVIFESIEQLGSALAELKESILAIGTAVSKLVDSKEAALEAHDERVGDGVEEKEAAVVAEDNTEPVEGVPAERKGALPETTMPDEAVTPTPAVRTLKSALEGYFKSRSQ